MKPGRTPWEKEWALLQKKELLFMNKYKQEKKAFLSEKLEKHIPETLENTLKKAFCKGFQTVLEKGTKVIEKTYSREKQETGYKINEYTASLKKNRRSLRAFGHQAELTKGRNLALSAAEGVGLGFLGIGLPDIPLFLGVIVRSIYEIALSYGYSYDTTQERCFILKLIETSLLNGEKLHECNAQIDALIDHADSWNFDVQTLSEQIKSSSDALSEELLYLKFLQGIPIIGVAGGLSDTIYLKRITTYASLKYKRRFLRDRSRSASTH